MSTRQVYAETPRLSRATLYKVLGTDGYPMHGGRGAWSLPTEDGPGEWRKVAGELIPCQNGLHVCTIDQLLENWLGPRIFVVEVDRLAGIVQDSGKIVCRRARLIRETGWTERTARLFAADCAEHVLPFYEALYPGDDRPRRAIQAARDYAEGHIDTVDWLAATSAATSAADSAAGSAAWSAAWSAATSAARSAATSAARSATGSAAWSAARSAAQSATWSAERSATWSAERSATWSAERAWQKRRLQHYFRVPS